MKLTTYLHLVLLLRMNGDVRSCPLRAFVARAGIVLDMQQYRRMYQLLVLFIVMLSLALSI
jgi:hypothetical protein